MLYTGSGTISQETREGVSFHVFHRGLHTPIYSDPKSCAVIFTVENWITSKISG